MRMQMQMRMRIQSCLPIILFTISLLIFFSNAHAGCLRFYFQDRKFFAKEIELTKALNTYDYQQIMEIEAQQKKSIIPLNAEISALQLFALYQIGFDSEIFCNPVMRSLDSIHSKFKNYFFNASLEARIKELQAKGKDSFKSFGVPVPTEFLKKRLLNFPDRIYLRSADHQSDFTSNFYYHLDPKTGKLFIKPNDQQHTPPTYYFKDGLLDIAPMGSVGNRGEWNQHGGGGTFSGGPQLPEGEKVVEFAVASEIVLAITNKNNTYLYKPTDFETPTQWGNKLGCPIPIKLNFPDVTKRKAWTYSCSVIEMPDTRRIEFMHPNDLVSYYEDSDGKKIAFGFTATAYLLWKNGRIISYWDTGLPANFYRGLTTPYRGDFIAENVSAAGSTLFIIGREPKEGKWKMFTKMYDYEINGACPGQHHTYKSCNDPDSECSCMKKDNVSALIAAHRKLPIEGWKEVQDILLPDGRPAAITTNITIITTGEGNNARELRVEGQNELGENGYYFKKINDERWGFYKTGLELTGQSLAYLSHTLPPITEHPHLAKDYEGVFKKGELVHGDEAKKKTKAELETNIKVELKDFHYFLGSDEISLLSVTLASGRKVDLNLYAVDAWTLTTQMKGHEELVGDPDIGPKILWGTIEIPKTLQQELESNDYYNDKELKSFITKYITPFHHLPNSLLMVANDREVSIQSVPYILKKLKTLKLSDVTPNIPGVIENNDYQNLPEIKISLINKKYGPSQSYFMRQVNQSELLLTASEEIGSKDKLQAVIKKNQAVADELSALYRNVSFYGVADSAIAELVYHGFPLAKTAALIFSPTNDIMYASIERFIPEAMRIYRDANAKQTVKSTVSYKNAQAILKRRIRHYQSRLN